MMNKDDKEIVPLRAYTLEEAAKLLDLNPGSIRNMISEKDPFIAEVNPQKVGKEWRFMGKNLLRALGTVGYTDKK